MKCVTIIEPFVNGLLFCLNSWNDNCLLNVPTLYNETEYNIFLDELPGQKYSLDEQCSQINGPGAVYCGVCLIFHFRLTFHFRSLEMSSIRDRLHLTNRRKMGITPEPISGLPCYNPFSLNLERCETVYSIGLLTRNFSLLIHK